MLRGLASGELPPTDDLRAWNLLCDVALDTEAWEEEEEDDDLENYEEEDGMLLEVKEEEGYDEELDVDEVLDVAFIQRSIDEAYAKAVAEGVLSHWVEVGGDGEHGGGKVPARISRACAGPKPASTKKNIVHEDAPLAANAMGTGLSAWKVLTVCSRCSRKMCSDASSRTMWTAERSRSSLRRPSTSAGASGVVSLAPSPAIADLLEPHTRDAVGTKDGPQVAREKLHVSLKLRKFLPVLPRTLLLSFRPCTGLSRADSCAD